jgi:AcrR family transcriptional regulator
MEPSNDRAGAVNTTLPSSRKSTQRERLIAGMIAVANRAGYAGTSVASVATEAKVSKPTFYEYFRDRDQCFVEALSEVQQQLLADIRATIVAGEPECAAVAAIRAIIAFAATDAQAARFLIYEPIAGGSRTADARDGGIDEVTALIETTLATVPADSPFPDLPIAAVVGGVYRMLATRLRRNRRVEPALENDVVAWLEQYNLPGSEHRWRCAGAENARLKRSPHLPSTPLHMPEALPPGRPRLSEAEVEANQRLRIISAAASLAVEKGYAATTITEIAKLARVDLRVLYSLFSEKQDIFQEGQALGLQELLTVTSMAYFTGTTWPDRCWEGGRAFLQFLETSPVTDIGIIEAYAIGPAAAQRVDDIYSPFTIFLQEGLQYSSKSELPSQLGLEAIVAVYFETVYRKVRASKPPKLSGLLPGLANLYFTPFLGHAETNRVIEAQAVKEAA